MTSLIFCLPHAGGGAHHYMSWAPHLDTDVEWVPLDYAGHFSRADEPLAESLAAMAQDLSIQMLRHAVGRSFVLFGHSMGGAVAFEVAHLLASQVPDAIRLLAISSARPPHRRDPAAPCHFALGDEEFIGHLVRAGGLSVAMAAHPVLTETLLPLVRHDYRLHHRYQPPVRPPLPVPITTFCGNAEEALHPEMAKWADLSTTPLSHKRYPGSHFYWRECLSTVAKDLSAQARFAATPL